MMATTRAAQRQNLQVPEKSSTGCSSCTAEITVSNVMASKSMAAQTPSPEDHSSKLY
jgi:hypothetical protein